MAEGEEGGKNVCLVFLNVFIIILKAILADFLFPKIKLEKRGTKASFCRGKVSPKKLKS